MDALTSFVARLQTAFADLREREEGQGMVEYALILALVAIASVAILTTLGGQVANVFSQISNALP